jgi:hypothetical protein
VQLRLLPRSSLGRLSLYLVGSRYLSMHGVLHTNPSFRLHTIIDGSYITS